MATHSTLAGPVTAATCSSHRIHPAKTWDGFSGFSGINGAALRAPHAPQTGCCWHKQASSARVGLQQHRQHDKAHDCKGWGCNSTGQVTDRHASLRASASTGVPAVGRARGAGARGSGGGAGGRKHQAFFQERARQKQAWSTHKCWRQQCTLQGGWFTRSQWMWVMTRRRAPGSHASGCRATGAATGHGE